MDMPSHLILNNTCIKMICYDAYTELDYKYKVPYEQQTVSEITKKKFCDYNVKIYQYFKTVNKWEYLIECVKNHVIDNNKYSWLNKFYLSNKSELKEYLKLFLTNDYDKKNTLVLFGTMNTGKSLLARSIGYFFKTIFVSNLEQSSSFFFSQFHGFNLAIIEEPAINLNTVEDYKKVLAGQPVSASRKGENVKVVIDEIPILITTNNLSLGKGNLCAADEGVLANRCRYIVLNNVVFPDVYLSPFDVIKYLIYIFFSYPTDV
uniref:Non-capsid protein n=1 Tax=Macrobrachium rosenbergii bidensovirus TaxID=2800469 RepID=A0A7T7FQS4_9VIRU|nr:non-capsid protein [Macrobrachium rosenbergii bidensovirus]